MKPITTKLALYLGVLLLGASCADDTLSQIGESIQSPRDKVESKLHHLRFEAESVRSQGVRTSSNTATLLGRIADPVYGDFFADYSVQMRTGKGYHFLHEPKDGAIDSVHLVLTAPSFVGDETAPMKLGIYELKRSRTAPLSAPDPFEEALRTPSALLGEYTGSISSATHWTKLSAQDSIRQIVLPLDKALGERIYRLSKEHNEYFATQEDFEYDVLGGIYVTPLTGSGSVLRIINTQLRIYYSYTDEKGKSQVGRETFIDTKQTTRRSRIANTYIEDLLKPSDDYLYIKQPAGVQVGLKLSEEQMSALLQGLGQMQIGTDWALADAQLKLSVSNPEDLLLNPPSYMLLLPKDSVNTFFDKQQTERTRVATTYLSSQYSVQARYYDFSNISRLITEHLKQHAKYTPSRGWTVDTPLELRVFPVERQTEKLNNSTEVTTSISEYFFPSFVRLDKQKGLAVDVISSKLKQ